MKTKRVWEKMQPLWLMVLAFSVVAGVACGDDEKDKPAENGKTDVGVQSDTSEESAPFALIGSWSTTNNNIEEITATRWNKMSVVEYNNEERWVITQNPSDALSANKYNKIVWTPIDRQEFYYCMVEVGRNELEQIKNSKIKADDSEPSKNGCPADNIRPWSFLSRL